MEWFETKVKFLRQMDNGLVKQITEQYLVDSMSFTEAEGRVMTEVGEGMREVTVVSIKRSAIKETVMYGDTDLFFKVKVSYSVMDEETEKEKKINTYLLVNANDAKEAYERTEEHLKEMLVPFNIVSIAASPIIEVYNYQAGTGLRSRKTHVADKAADLKSETNFVVNHSNLQGGDLHEKEIDCAYTKSQQVGRKRKHPLRSQDDAQPELESPFERRFQKSPTPPDISPNGLDSLDPTQGQAVTFSMDGVNTMAECENCGHVQDVYNREDCEKCGKSDWGSIRNDEEE